MPTRNQPCPCGSGRRYKHCCGVPGGDAGYARETAPRSDGPETNDDRYTAIGYYREEHRGKGMLPFCDGVPAGRAPSLPWAPPGLLVLENWLDADTCGRWCETFEGKRAHPAMVQDVNRRNSDGSPKLRPDEQRITEFVPLEELEGEIKATIKRAYTEVITPHFSSELQWMSPPGALKYRPGGRYNGHADSEYWDMQARRWIRSMDRDYSLLLYVNDDYEGGTLYFPNFDIRIRPRTGMLVAFPSDHRYLHAAEPLETGIRYAVVCWCAVRGVPKLHPMPPGAIV